MVIRGPLRDLGDVLAIARVEGKKALRVKRVRVLPSVVNEGSSYLVVVEDGCSEVSDVGDGKLHDG